MEFRVSSMGYLSVRPPTCRDTTGASRLEDVKEDVKAMTYSLAISDVARPARQIWYELRSLHYDYNNNNVVVGLLESQVISRVHRARVIHYSGDVHGSVEVPPVSLALNEVVSFYQFHFVSANCEGVNRYNQLLGCVHSVLLNLFRYNKATLFIDDAFRYVWHTWTVITVQDSSSLSLDPQYQPKLFTTLNLSNVNTAPQELFVGCLFHLKQSLRRATKRLAIPEAE
ncbi:hypothetical protein PHPALM_30487 [Phytophthora palmivora]|uniref:Uncharacterized protein n=1 Tax=Phytophthora palmivora TaxID=4796 RepID=A0A2P4X510_9STRA|nr:hypothetical protein PHPALM_30487 [Phytophthora palmivora]